jgi:Domain of unknown function (DUF3885)
MTFDRSIDSNTCRSKILAVFGEQALEHGLFYLHPYSLRVELSRGETYIKMFLRAYERSKAIIDFGYLLSLDQQILFHPYDDRGMDIIGNNRVVLEQIYTKFNDWLLDYDRLTMDEYFRAM